MQNGTMMKDSEMKGMPGYSKGAGGNWIKDAIKKPGALTAQAKRAGESPMDFAREHKGASGKTGKRSRLALTLSRFNKD